MTIDYLAEITKVNFSNKVDQDRVAEVMYEALLPEIAKEMNLPESSIASACENRETITVNDCIKLECRPVGIYIDCPHQGGYIKVDSYHQAWHDLINVLATWF